MLKFDKFTFKKDLKRNESMVLMYNEVPLLTIHTAGLKSIIQAAPNFLSYLDTLSANMDRTPKFNVWKIRVDEFIRVYNTERAKYYKADLTEHTLLSERDKNFKKVVLAIQLCDKHKISYLDFIKSQMEGLSFLSVERGGSFPTINHLCTWGAEERILRSRIYAKVKANILPQIKLGEDANIPLSKNTKFRSLFTVFKNDNNYLELPDLCYLEACIQARNKEIPPELSKAIELAVTKKLNKEQLSNPKFSELE
jgi:hypothetical protein